MVKPIDDALATAYKLGHFMALPERYPSGVLWQCMKDRCTAIAIETPSGVVIEEGSDKPCEGYNTMLGSPLG